MEIVKKMVENIQVKKHISKELLRFFEEHIMNIINAELIKTKNMLAIVYNEPKN